MIYDVIIIGGGPAGMTAAICAYQKFENKNAKILLIEKNKKLGKKLYATGNGKCNLGNTLLDLSCYDSNQEFFPYEIIDVHTHERICHFMGSMGVDITNKDGYLYPSSMQASSVVWAMTDKLKELGVHIHLNEECIKTVYDNHVYKVTTDKHTYSARNLILAPGGASAPKLGGSKNIYNMASQLGLAVYRPHPALCKLKTGADISMLSGVRSKARATLYVNENEYLTEFGEIQFTEDSLSGIMIFNLSCNAGNLIEQGNKLKIIVSLLPDKEEKEIAGFLKKARESCPQRTVYAILNGLINEKLAKYIISECISCKNMEIYNTQREHLSDKDIENCKSDNALQNKNDSISRTINTFTDMEIENLAYEIKHLEFDITECGSFDDSQVTSGGVDTTCINPASCEVYGNKGLFVAGEYLDVTGKCGGYNIMWAIVTGMKAGEGVR